MIFHYKGIQIHLRKDQCLKLKYILSYSDEFNEFEDLDCKLNDAILKMKDVQLNIHEFKWIKENMHLSRC
jgi:hypothetical protein